MRHAHLFRDTTRILTEAHTKNSPTVRTIGLFFVASRRILSKLSELPTGFEQLVHCSFEGASVGGGIETEVPFAADAECRSVVEAQVGLLGEETQQLIVGKSQTPAVEPHEIGPLVAVGANGGNVFFEEIADIIHVAFDVVEYLIEPILAAVVGDFQRDAAEAVALVAMYFVEFLQETVA